MPNAAQCRADGRPLVVKLGGSLVESGRLKAILALVATARVPVVIVPGGGGFADAVRVLQSDMGFDDPTAHRLAILATEQTAHMLMALAPHLEAAATFEQLQLTQDGKVPVWLPWRLAGQATDIPEDWSITSDGLALWLAGRIGAAGLVLVKSCAVSSQADAAALAVAGVIDPWFAANVARLGIPWCAVGPADDALLADLLTGRETVRAIERRRAGIDMIPHKT